MARVGPSSDILPHYVVGFLVGRIHTPSSPIKVFTWGGGTPTRFCLGRGDSKDLAFTVGNTEYLRNLIVG